MSKRAASEAAVLKLTKADEELLEEVAKEKARLKAEEDAKWAHVQIPVPVLNMGDVKAILKRISRWITLQMVEDEPFPMHLQLNFTSDSKWSTIFADVTLLNEWYLKMKPFVDTFGGADYWTRQAAGIWIKKQMCVLLLSLVAEWNRHHTRFQLKHYDEGLIVELY